MIVGLDDGVATIIILGMVMVFLMAVIWVTK